MNRRNVVAFKLLLSISLLFGASAYASETPVNIINSTHLSTADIERLVQFGFSNEEIEAMSVEEYQKFNEKFDVDSSGSSDHSPISKPIAGLRKA